jgi:hypothetical protein
MELFRRSPILTLFLLHQQLQVTGNIMTCVGQKQQIYVVLLADSGQNKITLYS